MIIAHGPIGYLIARGTKRWWGQYNFSKRQSTTLWLAGAVGGIFPDVDLFYFYLIDASISHRQLLTHSFITYGVLMVIGLVIIRWRRPWLGWLVTLLALGGVSHIFADMYVGMTAGLAPFSNTVFGLLSIPGIASSWFERYSFVVNYVTEFVFCLVALASVVQQYRRRFFIGAVTASLLLLGLLLWLNQHILKPNGTFYYSDTDADGMIAAQDRDSDGDGFVNIIDTDIDNDGEDNSLDFYRETFAADGAIYDYSSGRFVEVPLRIGLVTEVVLIQRLYANIGIFFASELAYDYQFRPDGYIGSPKDNQFADSPVNWANWLWHRRRLLDPTTRKQEFDVVFFTSGHVGIYVFGPNDQDRILEADPSHVYATAVPLDEVIQREGEVTALGRILPKPFTKQY